MIVFETRKSRRIVTRLERGEELVATLESLAAEKQVKSAWVRGIGTLEWAELTRHDQQLGRPEPPQHFEGGLETLSLEGSVSMDQKAPRARLHATLSRRTDNGVALLGGQLKAARVYDFELVLEVFEDLRLERAEDEETGLGLWMGVARPGVEARRPAPPTALTRGWIEAEEQVDAPVPEAPKGAISWADLAQASAAVPSAGSPPGRPVAAAPAEDEDAYPERGDWIEHRQFGLCRIEKEDADGGVLICLPSGRRKTLKLGVMEVLPPRRDGSRRIFPIRPRTRR